MKLLTKLQRKVGIAKDYMKEKAAKYRVESTNRGLPSRCEQKTSSSTPTRDDKILYAIDQSHIDTSSTLQDHLQPTPEVQAQGNSSGPGSACDAAQAHHSKDNPHLVSDHDSRNEDGTLGIEERLTNLSAGTLHNEHHKVDAKYTTRAQDPNGESTPSLSSNTISHEIAASSSVSNLSCEDHGQAEYNLLAKTKHDLPIIVITTTDETVANCSVQLPLYGDYPSNARQEAFPLDHCLVKSWLPVVAMPDVQHHDRNDSESVYSKDESIHQSSTEAAEPSGGTDAADLESQGQWHREKMGEQQAHNTAEIPTSAKEEEGVSDQETDNDGDNSSEATSENLELNSSDMKTLISSLLNYNEKDASDLLSRMRETEDLEELVKSVRAENEKPDIPARYQLLYEAVNFETLQKVALGVRKEQLIKAGQNVSNNMTCEVFEEPKCGSFNMCLCIEFSDEVLWVAKIPGYGLSPTKAQQDKMNSEYMTQQYVRSKTDFEMPDVYYWTTERTQIGAAFGLISYIHGVALHDCWFDKDFSQDRCLKAISDIAREMSKLYTMQFPRTGMLCFNKEQDVTHVGPEIEYSCKDDCHWGDSTLVGPFDSNVAWIKHNIAKHRKHRLRRLRSAPKDWRDEVSRHNVALMLGTVPLWMRNAPLSLCLADPDFQNIFVDFETGALTGFIDLDNIHVAPVTVGAAAYPPVLTRDRNPGLFLEEAAAGCYHPHGGIDVYKEYRKHYASEFAAALPSSITYDPRWTLLSHHQCLLEYATWVDYEWRNEILTQMVRDTYYKVRGGVIDDPVTVKMRKTDLSSIKPWRKLRLRRTIAQGLWQPEFEIDTGIHAIEHAEPQPFGNTKALSFSPKRSTVSRRSRQVLNNLDTGKLFTFCGMGSRVVK